MNCSVRVVVVPTKVIKFLLITTIFPLMMTSMRCCCTYKGNQIFANHNASRLWNYGITVVVVPTKVIKFLLITTHTIHTLAGRSCCCTYKGNQIFANHN